MSDHFSGPRAIAGPAGDICDLYAFPSPDNPGHLVLVLDVLPNASHDSFFSEAIICRFRLRPVTIGGVGPKAAFPFAGEDKEMVFSATSRFLSKEEPVCRRCRKVGVWRRLVRQHASVSTTSREGVATASVYMPV